MKHTVVSMMMVSLSLGLAAGCTASDAGSRQAARLVTAAIEQHLVRGDDELCSRWTECYLGCAAMPCDDDASCTEQQAAYASCDASNAPAPDYCPLPV